MLLHLPLRLLAAIKQRAALGSTSSGTSSEEAPALGGGSSRPGPLVSLVSAFAQSSGDTVVDLTAADPADVETFGAAASGGGRGDGAVALNAAAFSQLLLDMHRQAGIMLLDRMGPYLVNVLAQHVMTALQVSAHVQGSCCSHFGHHAAAAAPARLHHLVLAGCLLRQSISCHVLQPHK